MHIQFTGTVLDTYCHLAGLESRAARGASPGSDFLVAASGSPQGDHGSPPRCYRHVRTLTAATDGRAVNDVASAVTSGGDVGDPVTLGVRGPSRRGCDVDSEHIRQHRRGEFGG